MKKLKIAFYILLILLGIFIFIFGGYDDSPGAQLLGCVIGFFGIFRIIKSVKKNN